MNKPYLPYAIAVLVLGILSIVIPVLGIALAIVAIVLAASDLRRNQQAPDAYVGQGMLQSGRVLAFVGLGVSTLGLIFMLSCAWMCHHDGGCGGRWGRHGMHHGGMMGGGCQGGMMDGGCCGSMGMGGEMGCHKKPGCCGMMGGTQGGMMGGCHGGMMAPGGGSCPMMPGRADSSRTGASGTSGRPM